MTVFEVSILECPQCAAIVEKGSNTCPKCYSPYIVTSVSSLKKFDDAGIRKYLKAYEASLRDGGDSVELFTAMGICHLKRRVYAHADNCFEKAIALLPEDGDAYYFAAISLLAGKSAFYALRPAVKKIETYLQNAIDLDPKAEYYALWAYVKQDYFARKYLNTSPGYSELLAEAIAHGYTSADAEILFETLSVEQPAALRVS